jgi:hypothetical protein
MSIRRQKKRQECRPKNTHLISSARHAAKVVSINAIIFIAFIAALDLILGDYLRPKPFAAKIPGALYDVTREYSLPKPIWGAFANDNIQYTRDSNGYRGRKRNNWPIILTIGGSTTDERYVDDRKTWSEVAESMINANAEFKYEVINGGVDGQSSWGHSFSIDEWHSKALANDKVNAIVFYIGYNDARLLGDPLGKTPFDNPSSARRIHNYLMRNSFFYYRAVQIRHHFQGLRLSKENKVSIIGHKPRDWGFLHYGINEIPLASKASYNTQAYKKLFTNTLISARRSFPKAKVFVIQQYIPGCRFRDGIAINRLSTESARSRYCQQFTEVFNLQQSALDELEASHRKAVTLIEMYKYFAAPDSGFYDDIHSSDKGSWAIGAYIGRLLRNSL